MTRRTKLERMLADMASASDEDAFAVVAAGLERLSVPSVRNLVGTVDPLILAILRESTESASEGEA